MAFYLYLAMKLPYHPSVVTYVIMRQQIDTNEPLELTVQRVGNRH